MNRTTLFTILFLLVSGLSFGQSFGSEGTEWEYCLMEEYEGDNSTFALYTFSHIENASGINSIEVKRSNGFELLLDTLQIYEVDNQLLMEDYDSTYLFFDYNLEIGDTFSIRLPEEFNQKLYGAPWNQDLLDEAYSSETLVTIDDKVNVNIDGEILMQWQFGSIFMESNANILTQFSFTERMGYDGFFLPIISVDYLEYNPLGAIVKYSDNQISFQASSNNCTLVSTEEISPFNIGSIFPNPTTGELTIELPYLMSGLLSVRDVTSQLVLTVDLDNSDELKLDLGSYDSGMYLLELVSESGKRYVERVVKVED